MRKCYVKVEFNLIISMDEDANFEDIMNEMDYSFIETTGTGDILDSQMVDFVVEDSK